MSQTETITVPRWTFVSMVICLTVSTVAHLFRLALDFIR